MITRKDLKSNLLIITLITIIILLLGVIFLKEERVKTVIVNTKTTERVLKNGQKSTVKVFTPEVKKPEEVGFSKKFVKDTINKIVGVKEKQIKELKHYTGTYKDSLRFIREELDENKKLVKYYESLDKKSRAIVRDSIINYTGDINLITVVKKGKKVDSLIFYDPNQRITINNSKEYRVLQKKPSKIKVGISAGVGLVTPTSSFNPQVGYFIGPSITLSF